MFGWERSIVDEFPKYFLDYREKVSDEVRLDYRVISSYGTQSGNLFDFYFKIINKITDNLNIPLRTIDGIRQEDTRVHKAVGEADGVGRRTKYQLSGMFDDENSSFIED